MHDAFRNYDAWLTTDPNLDGGDEPWTYLPRCSCGAWLRFHPDKVERVENIITEQMPGGYQEVQDWSFSRHHHTCRKCGKDNVFGDL